MTITKTTKDVSTWKTNQPIADLAKSPAMQAQGPPTLVAIPGTGVARVRLRQTGPNSQEAENVLHMVYNDPNATGTVDPADLVPDITSWITQFVTFIAGKIVDNINWTEFVLYVFNYATGTFTNVGGASLALAGTDAVNNALPYQLAVKGTINTAVPEIQGGLYQSGWPVTMVGASGLILGTELTNLADYLLNIYAPYSGVKFDLYPGIWSQGLQTLGVARTVTVDNLWDYQGRRKLGRGS